MKEIICFFEENKDLIGSIGNFFTIIGVIGGLWFNAYSIRENTKIVRISNLFQVTQDHREIWTLRMEHPSLQRVFDGKLDYDDVVVTSEENLFISFLILHLNLGYQAAKVNSITRIEGTEEDIKRFFSLPIPRKVWFNIKRFQNKDFVAFVENNMPAFVPVGNKPSNPGATIDFNKIQQKVKSKKKLGKK